MKEDVSTFSQTVTSNPVSINELETLIGHILPHINLRQKGGLPNETMAITKRENWRWSGHFSIRFGVTNHSLMFDFMHLKRWVCKTWRIVKFYLWFSIPIGDLKQDRLCTLTKDWNPFIYGDKIDIRHITKSLGEIN